MEATEDVQVELGSLLDAGDGATVTLVAGDTQLVGHRAVLAARSPVFAGMFAHDTLEARSGQVAVPDVGGAALRGLLAYLYCQHAPQLEPPAAAHLLVAADKYGAEGLKAHCERQLAARLTVEDAANVAVLAVRHSCPALTQAAVAFVKANPQVMETPGWAQALLDHPRDVAELRRLLAEAPEATSTSTAGRSIPNFKPPPDPNAVCRMRSIPEEERNMRLLMMSQMGSVEELKVLLTAGANVDVKDEGFYSMTALQWAAARGHTEAVRCLIEAGAEVDARDRTRCTALHSSAYRGRVAVVRALLASSADPNASNQWRRTPLHEAAQQGHTEVVVALLAAGADRAARADNSYTPLDLAVRNNRQPVVELLS